jgi:hypothetical protein
VGEESQIEAGGIYQSSPCRRTVAVTSNSHPRCSERWRP